MDTMHRDQPEPTPGNRDEQVPRVVVGVDGSPGARLALAWALSEAARRAATLLVLSAFPVEAYWLDPYFLDPDRIEAVRQETEARTRDAVGDVLHQPDVTAVPGAATVPVHVLAVPGPVVPSLVQHSSTADLLVVGSRGRGGVRSTVLGSVALHCAASADCPVVVVHPVSGGMHAGGSDGRLVVGLDEASQGRAALVAAIDEAVRRDARVQAVLAYEGPDYWSEMYAGLTPPPAQRRARALERARNLVEDVVAEDVARGRDHDVAVVEVLVQEGSAGEVLVREAAGAELLVVGSRSHSSLPAMLLGSVALHCAIHAPCPVMIVRPEPEPARPRAAVAATPAAHR
ncbi:MAG: universal stress protein [Blastococcus sp.]|nr:universal stress protein [Blastococcus sp.]